MEIKEFIEKYGDLNRLDGNHYRGDLDLRGTGVTSLPEGEQEASYRHERQIPEVLRRFDAHDPTASK